MIVEKTVWLSVQSYQLLNEIRDGLTEGQKEYLKRHTYVAQNKSRLGCYKKCILSQAVEIGLLSLKRDYSIERDLTDEEKGSTVKPPSPKEKVILSPKEKVKPPSPKEKELPMDEIIKDYLSGMGFVEIGAKYKIAHSTAFRRIRKAGVTTR